MYSANSKIERLKLNFLQYGEEMNKNLFNCNKSDSTKHGWLVKNVKMPNFQIDFYTFYKYTLYAIYDRINLKGGVLVKRKLMGLVVSLLLCFQLITPFEVIKAAQVLYDNATGNQDGYDYEWKRQD